MWLVNRWKFVVWLLISDSMKAVVSAFLSTLRSGFRTRAGMHLEILALRHQVAVLRRRVNKRPRMRTTDRLLWVVLSRVWWQWRSALVIVKPETVIAWQRKGFRLYWRWKSRAGNSGRPCLSREIRELIRTDEHGESALGRTANSW